MNDDDLDKILMKTKAALESSEKHFNELGWSDSEVSEALGAVGLTFSILSANSHILNIRHKHFPEILRAVANLIDLEVNK